MCLRSNMTLAIVLLILHLLLSLLLFPIYIQPEPPIEVALCLSFIPCFVLVYVIIVW
ncbi:hypothetical protein Lalb_Chr20g0108491 [Lupinus albus]|uniref:Transmembrane protein n=1 Tax=Lupinus albus TaxID=3870 RepID=A0A6A4NNM8_LUPAL|nr:hypothetical protein Lalb_Chr20g0108491 [Lupinus albus]